MLKNSKTIWMMKTRIKYRSIIKKNKAKINSLFEKNRQIILPGNCIMSDDDKEMWRKTLCAYNNSRPSEALLMAQVFVEENVYLAKRTYVEPINPKTPILLCNVKNDLERIKLVINHHRKLGIEHFAILDNNSDDGTYEWLMEQEIDVYRVKERYTSIVRAAWIAKIAMCYGLDRWYVIVDSDELLVYEDMENKSIQELIVDMEQHNLQRGLGFMIDMYAESSSLREKTDSVDIWSRYRFFDTSSYSKEKGITQINIFGGPRDRYFGKKEDATRELLTKYPLVFWEQGEIYRYHFMFPLNKNFSSPIFLGLLHYKFLDGDYDKYLKIVKDGNYAGGSEYYKRYIDRLGDCESISFMDDQTVEFTSSQDLKQISIYEGINKRM